VLSFDVAASRWSAEMTPVRRNDEKHASEGEGEGSPCDDGSRGPGRAVIRGQARSLRTRLSAVVLGQAGRIRPAAHTNVAALWGTSEVPDCRTPEVLGHLGACKRNCGDLNAVWPPSPPVVL